MVTPASWCPPAPSPEEDFQTLISSLCKIGWRPILITGLIRDLLVRHFSTADHIEDSDLKQFLWRPDEQTGILVESVYRWRPELTEKRPAILIKRNAYRNQTLGINDVASLTQTGHRVMTTSWVGSHTVFCLSRTAAGADILATEVQRELTRFSLPLKQYLGLLDWRVVEVGEPAEAEESKTTYVVPVSVAWSYLENWVTYEQAPWLRRINLEILLRPDEVFQV